MGAIPLLSIVGPTATGKTVVAVEVAKRLGGEIVSADSMLVYRYMDVGTAKPTAEERQGIPHHMIDIVNPDEAYSVARYQEQAERCIREIASRGKLPLLVGGTGLYVRAVVDRYNFPPGGYDPELRRRLEEEAKTSGAEAMHYRLACIDPEAAGKIHPRNLKRVIRALEIFYLTGRLPSRGERKKEGPGYNLVMFGLVLERSLLYRRIEERVDKMLSAGLVEEVRQLLARGYGPELVSMQGLGYKEMVQYLLGRTTLEEAVRLLKRNTRRFAKRQLTWFGRDPQIRWLDVGRYPGKKEIAGEIVRLAEGVFKDASKS